MRHCFNFEGGEILTTLGASWFVSYAYYKYINKQHLNWQKVATASNRINNFNLSKPYHKFWLNEILKMDDKKLNTNKIDLNAGKIKQMSRELMTII